MNPENETRDEFGYATLRRAMPEPGAGENVRFADFSERSLRYTAFVAYATDAAVP